MPAAVALSRTLVELVAEHVDEPRADGLADSEFGDVGASAPFFSWAHRLLPSLGEPERPADQEPTEEERAR